MRKEYVSVQSVVHNQPEPATLAEPEDPVTTSHQACMVSQPKCHKVMVRRQFSGCVRFSTRCGILGVVPVDWKNGTVICIPKTRNLVECDNWSE